MDRHFSTPENAARAGEQRVNEVLVTILRRGVEDQPFVLRQRFEFDGGRRAPLLFIGTINRAWRDYINANARATDLVTGTCSTGRGTPGRVLVQMQVSSGRGASSGNQLEINRAFRAINVEVNFASESGVGAQPPSRSTVGDAGAPPAAGAPQASGDAARAADPAKALMAGAQELRDMFEGFKAAPSADGLSALNAKVAAWQALAAGVSGAQNSKAGQFVTRLAGLLAAKGQAFVDHKSTG